ncbi:MAG: hypothetical protein OXH77_09325 [Anaerolineaceae bacterium]|nr:hypothetical protein [Anaerolineaceae bacterium]
MSRQLRVNTVDIRDAVQLGCQTMTRAFNRHDADRPFFSAFVRPAARLGWSSQYTDAHVPGRHLNALVAAKTNLGLEIDDETVRKHADAMFFSFSGEIPLPLNRATIKAGKPDVFLAHNLREGFHGLNALILGYEDNQAFDLARRSVDFIQKNWNPRSGWSFQETPSGFIPNHVVSGIGRAIGPLVKIYANSGHGPALALAQDIAVAALEFFPEDGRYPGNRLGSHVHSITSTLSSLAQLAEMTGDSGLMHRVAAFHDHGLWEIRDEVGWAIESTRPGANPDRGEVNTSGDILETALILGAQHDSAYYGDAERILRCHILPSQLRDISWSVAREDGSLPSGSVFARLQGAWGFPAPYGHEPVGLQSVQFNLDIVGGTVASLCEFSRRSSSRDGENRVWLNCLTDLDDEAIRVRTPYTQDSLSILLKEQGALAIRVPNWFAGDPAAYADRNNLMYADGYWHFESTVVPQLLELPLTLEPQSIVLRHKTCDIRAILAGDSVISMENHGADLTFFAAPAS